MDAPRELKELRQWVTWKLVGRAKIPFQSDGQTKAQTNNPLTWCSYDEAVASGLGIGFVFSETDPYCGIDLDDCIIDGRYSQHAIDILDKFAGKCWAEISPSGNGLKLTFRATKPEGSRCSTRGIECYDRRRFWAWTGQTLGVGFDRIGDAQRELEWFLENYLPSNDQKRAPQEPAIVPVDCNSSLELRANNYIESASRPQPGERNNTLFRLAGHVAAIVDSDGRRLDDEWILARLLEWNASLPEPLSAHEAERTIRSALQNGTPRPAKAPSRLADYATDSDVDISAIINPKERKTGTEPLGEDVIPPEGIIREVVDFNLATAHRPQPILALAGAIALMSVLTGRKVEFQSRGRTNVYLLGVGKSGSGKEHARQVNKLLLDAIGKEQLIGPESFGSSAGLVKSISLRLAALYQVDEIGNMLATMKSPAKSPHLYNIATELMKLYSSADTVYLGSAYADEKKNLSIHCPHVVLYGTCTHDVLWGSLTAESLSNGLLGRLLVFEADGQARRQHSAAQMDPPRELLKKLGAWGDYTPGIDWGRPDPDVIGIQRDAQDRYIAHVDAIDEKAMSEDDIRSAIWQRTAEKSLKLAMIFACARHLPRDEISISLDDMDRGIRIANWSTRRILHQVDEYVASNWIEENKKRLLRILSKQWQTKTEICRKTRWLRAKERDEILEELASTGDIEIATEIDGEQKQRTKSTLYIRRT